MPFESEMRNVSNLHVMALLLYYLDVLPTTYPYPPTYQKYFRLMFSRPPQLSIHYIVTIKTIIL